uniref:Poly-A binding protein n=1 Tax=Rhizophora mucronata TaxID=61149 RepID=A0A2P2K6L9_RHIMU
MFVNHQSLFLLDYLFQFIHISGKCLDFCDYLVDGLCDCAIYVLSWLVNCGAPLIFNSFLSCFISLKAQVIDIILKVVVMNEEQDAFLIVLSCVFDSLVSLSPCF